MFLCSCVFFVNKSINQFPFKKGKIVLQQMCFRVFKKLFNDGSICVVNGVQCRFQLPVLRFCNVVVCLF